jgi:hypothetical protein
MLEVTNKVGKEAKKRKKKKGKGKGKIEEKGKGTGQKKARSKRVSLSGFLPSISVFKEQKKYRPHEGIWMRTRSHKVRC